MPGTRRLPIAAVALAVAAVLAAGCSKDNNSSSPTTTGARPGGSGTVAASDAGDRLADAKTAAVAYFEALAVNDYDKGLARSSGGAAEVVRWARGVNNVDAARDSGYQVPTLPAPNVRVQIDALQPGPAGTWLASGFLELGERPGGIASTTTTAPPGSVPTTRTGGPVTYVTDLVFVEEREHLQLADYRYDDVPYPVSQLYLPVAGSDGSADGASARLTHARRNLDGSVQYLVALEGANGVSQARFLEPAQGTAPGTPGAPVQVYSDPPGSDGVADALLVRAGAFPGGPGTLRLSVTGAGRTTGTGVPATTRPPATTSTSGAEATIDLAVPPFPELTARPVNVVRDQQQGSSTTSSSTSSTSSSTSTPGGTVTTLVPTPTVQPTTTSASSSTSSSATTTTTAKTTTTTR